MRHEIRDQPQPLLARPQCHLHPLPFGDIAHHAQHAGITSVGDHPGGNIEVQHASVRQAQRGVPVQAFPPRLQHLQKSEPLFFPDPSHIFQTGLPDHFLRRTSPQRAERIVRTDDRAIGQPGDDHAIRAQPEGFCEQLLTLAQCPLRKFARGDVRADSHILARLSLLVEKRRDGRIHPIKRTVFRAVPDLAVPEFAARDRRPQLADEFLWMETRMDDPVILPEQILARIFRDRAELIVHKSDPPLRIGDRHDGVRLERRPQIVHLPERHLQFIFDRFPLVRRVPFRRPFF